MQTRGKPTLALRHSGGAIRSIDEAFVAIALEAARLPFDAETVEHVHGLLKERLYIVDAPPTVVRDEPEAIEKLEKAAGNLLDAVRQLRAWPEINLALSDFFVEKGWPHDQRMLVKELLVLQNARQHLFDSYNPTEGYHLLIRRLRDGLAVRGGNTAVHGKSCFITFLLLIEAERPALIFPPMTTSTERGRCRYVERALEGASPNTRE
jgi:hypothetical protein